MPRKIKECVLFWLPVAVYVTLIGIIFMTNAEADEKEITCTSVEDNCGWSPIDYWHLMGYKLCANINPPALDSRHSEIYYSL